MSSFLSKSIFFSVLLNFVQPGYCPTLIPGEAYSLVDFVQDSSWTGPKGIRPICAKFGHYGVITDCLVGQIIPELMVSRDNFERWGCDKESMNGCCLKMFVILQAIREDVAVFEDKKFTELFIDCLEQLLGHQTTSARALLYGLRSLAYKNKNRSPHEIFKQFNGLPEPLKICFGQIVTSCGKNSFFCQPDLLCYQWEEFFDPDFKTSLQKLVAGNRSFVSLGCLFGGHVWKTLIFYRHESGEIKHVWLEAGALKEGSVDEFLQEKQAVTCACYRLLGSNLTSDEVLIAENRFEHSAKMSFLFDRLIKQEPLIKNATLTRTLFGYGKKASKELGKLYASIIAAPVNDRVVNYAIESSIEGLQIFCPGGESDSPSPMKGSGLPGGAFYPLLSLR